jgi:hypothetical protein
MRLPELNLRPEYKQTKRAFFQRVLGQFQGGWNKDDRLGVQHSPQLAGRMAIANLLDTMSLPRGYEVFYKGTHRSSGLGGHGIEDGELQYQLKLRSRSGAQHFIDIPLVVRAGQVETPSIMYYGNQPMIIAQSSFNRIIEAAEFKEKIPDRSNMYSLPNGKVEGEVYRWQRGIRASADADADTEGGGEAEVLPSREEVMREFAPTSRVKLTREFVYIGRGGQRFHMDKGMKGTVVRVTTEGVLVAFDDSFTVQVPADALS